MTQKEFEDLIRRLEVFARENPSAYTTRTILLAAVGYLFLFATVGGALVIVSILAVAGSKNLAIIKFLIIPLGLSAVIVRSLWIKFPRPEGHRLEYRDAPRLFDLANEIQKATKGRRLHKILLTDEFNAGIAQWPRLGPLGWQENYLLVGLPMLHALSLEDFRAVLAHEFGHLSANHSRFAGWIYRVRQSWVQLLTNLRQNRRSGSALIEKFFNWYAPYFAAYSFVLARTHEYAADRIAVELCGKDAVARALINTQLRQRALQEIFWPQLFRQADSELDPPADAFSRMLKALGEPIAPDMRQRWFTQGLMAKHGYDDTHPSLVDRLVALGYPAIKEHADISSFLDGNGLKSSDRDFLVSLPADFVTSRNVSLKEGISPQWRDRYYFVRNAEQSLAQISKKADAGQLTIDELWERARLIMLTTDHPTAIPYLRQVVAEQPDHAAANYTLGEALLEQGDESGIQNIERAMDTDMSSIPAGCELIYHFLICKERSAEAEKYREFAQDYCAEVELARYERNVITTRDTFVPHDLPAENIAELCRQLKNNPRLKVAYLVRKVVKHFPDEPSYVLGVVPKHPWYIHNRATPNQKLVDQLVTQVSYPGYTYIIVLEDSYKSLRRNLKRVDGAEIYRKR